MQRQLESVGEQAPQHLGHLIYRRSIGQFGDDVVFDRSLPAIPSAASRKGHESVRHQRTQPKSLPQHVTGPRSQKLEIHMKLQNATCAMAQKLLKDHPDGFIANSTFPYPHYFRIPY